MGRKVVTHNSQSDLRLEIERDRILTYPESALESQIASKNNFIVDYCLSHFNSYRVTRRGFTNISENMQVGLRLSSEKRFLLKTRENVELGERRMLYPYKKKH